MVWVYANKDTWVDEADPAASHGYESRLRLSKNGTNDTWVLLHFPITVAVPPGQYVYSASLNLHAFDAFSTTQYVDIEMFTLASAFSESTANWSNKPPQSSMVWQDTIGGETQQMDVTDAVRAWLEGAESPDGGLGIAPEYFGRDDFFFEYGSREDWVDPPRIVLFCGSDPLTPTPTPTPTRTPTPTATPISWDLVAHHVNVVQAVQDSDNSVPLVTDKPTFVRFLAKARESGHYAVLPLLNATGEINYAASLRAYRNGQELSSISPVITPQGIGEYLDYWNYFFVFQLPLVWMDGLPMELEVTIDPIAAYEPEAWRVNNTIAITIDPEPVPPICVVFIPVDANGLGAPSSIYMYGGKGAEMLHRAKTMLPADIWPYHLPPLDGSYNTDSLINGSEILNALEERDRYTADPVDCINADARTHLAGMLYYQDGPAAGLAMVYGNNLWFMISEDDGPNFLSVWGPLLNNPMGGVFLAHELGHNYGMWHTDCGNPGYTGSWPYENTCWIGDAQHPNIGFEPDTRTSMHWTEIADLMSYQWPQWTAGITWQRFYDQLRGQMTAAAANASSNLALPADLDEVLIVSGFSAGDGVTATLTTALVQTEYLPPTKLAKLLAPQEGESTLNLRGEDGALLASYPLAQKRLLGASAAGTETAGWTFRIGVPVPEGIESIEVVGTKGVLAAKTLSAHAPQVTLLSPNGGETIQDPFVIRWQASDADGDDLTYMVQYSSDGGERWQALVTNAATTTYTTTVAFLAGGTQSLIRVIANDGVLTGSDESDAVFQVPRHAPIAFIYTPDGERFESGQMVILEGGGTDNEDGHLQGEALRWTVSGLATDEPGETLTLFDVPPGTYEAILTARDSDGMSGTATIHFAVGHSLYLPVIVR